MIDPYMEQMLETNTPSGIGVFIRDEEEFQSVFTTAINLARRRGESLQILTPAAEEEIGTWLEPELNDTEEVEIAHLQEENISRELITWERNSNPIAMLFSMSVEAMDTRNLVPEDIEGALLRIRCPVGLIDSRGRERSAKKLAGQSLVSFNGDSHSFFALKTALLINPGTKITVVATAQESRDGDERTATQQQLRAALEEQLGELFDESRVTVRVLFGAREQKQFFNELDHFDSLIIGSSRGNIFTRAMIGERAAIETGDFARELITKSDIPVVIVREYQGLLGSTFSMAISRGGNLLPSVTSQERIAIYKEVRRAAWPRIDFYLMIALSSAIASMGLLLNSPAVIIGAMLIAPLMSAIIGTGLAMVQGNQRFLLSSAAASIKGSATALAVGIFIGLFNLKGTVTAEMLGRTGPSLLDLAIAALSGAAAAYALCRKDVSASLPGVAIAVALVPPLATTGLFVGIGDFENAYGALLLFVTNLVAIAFSSGIIFTMVGFKPAADATRNLDRILAFRRGFFIVGLLVLLVSTNLTVRTIDQSLDDNFDNKVETVVASFLKSDIEREVVLLGVSVHNRDRELIDVVVRASSSTDITQEEVEDLSEVLAQHTEHPLRVSVVNTALISALSGVKSEESIEE